MRLPWRIGGKWNKFSRVSLTKKTTHMVSELHERTKHDEKQNMIQSKLTYSSRPRKQFVRKPNFHPAAPLRLRLLAALHETKELDVLEAHEKLLDRVNSIQDIHIYEQFRIKIDRERCCCYVWTVTGDSSSSRSSISLPRTVTISELESFDKGSLEINGHRLPPALVEVLLRGVSNQ